MSDMRPELLNELLALPAADRAKLAEELLASLEEGSDPDAAEAWVKEIERRVREIDDGTAEMVPWDVVRNRILDRLRKR